MKMQLDRGTVMDNLSGVARVMNYRIDEEDTGMVMDIIANRTYSQKQLAVVREYICNAYDAHVEAGNQNKPFDVTVPTALEPMFKVRDYGQGLSVEDVERIYMRVAKSTKRNSNSVIGAYGIGSKAAFCYSDSFIITSWHNGICSKYISQINAQKQAQGLHLSSEPSNEPNGIEIQVAVKPDDAKLFKTLILDICSMFPTKPNIFGTSDALPEIKKLIAGSCWYIDAEKLESGYYLSTITAVCGHVKYNIDLKNIGANLSDDVPVLKGTHLEFELGEVDIPPSRETLEYTQKTIDAIKAKMKIFASELNGSIQDQMNNCKNIADAMKLLPSWGHRKEFTYKGHNLHKLSKMTCPTGGKVLFYCSGRFKKSNRLSYLELDNDATAIVVEDANHAEYKARLNLTSFKKIVIIPDSSELKLSLALDLLPAERIFFSSKMRKPQVSRTNHNKGSIAPNFFSIVCGERYTPSSGSVNLRPLQNEPTEKAIFFEMKGSKLVDNISSDVITYIKKFCDKMPICAVRSKIVGSLDRSKWISAKDFIKNLSQEKLKSVTQEMIDVEKRNRDTSMKFNMDFLEHPEVNAIKEEILLFEKTKVAVRQWQILTYLCADMSIEVSNPFGGESVASADSIDNKIKKFFNKYPLLKFVNNNGAFQTIHVDNAMISDMIEYIKSKE